MVPGVDVDEVAEASGGFGVEANPNAFAVDDLLQDTYGVAENQHADGTGLEEGGG